MIRKLFAGLLLCALCNMPAWAQHTQADQEPAASLATARELFAKGQYATAQQAYQRYVDALGIHASSDPAYPECQYAMGACALRLKNMSGARQLEAFTEAYGATPWGRKAFADLGNYYFEQQDYKNAVKYLKHTEVTKVSSNEDIELVFREAYSYYALKDYKKARLLFSKVNTGLHKYAAPASYYSGYLAYLDKDYAKAIEALERASRDAAYKNEADVLIPNIYYKQQQYNKVAAFVKKYEDEGRKMPAGLALLAGEVYYRANGFEKARKYFLEYMEAEQGKAERGVYYRLGYACLQQGDKENAIRYLGKAADGNDELAQVAAYHLGLTYISANKKNLADIAFDKARKININPELQELSAFYYVKVSYDNENYAQTIDAGNFYQETFPEGKKREEVYDLQGDALLKTGDYGKALEILLKIPNKTQKQRQNLQLIAYNKGVQEYNDEKYRDAVSSLSKSLDYPVDKALEANTNLWLGEIYSLGNKYDEALVYYKRIDAQYEAYTDALYGMGYSYFNKRDYEKALGMFKAYIARPANGNREKQVDALVRLADCHYANKQYAEAINVYNAAIRSRTPDLDYVYYQKSLAEEAVGSLNDASRSLDQLIAEFPNSKNMDRALFQKGMLLFNNGRMDDATVWFGKFIEKFPTHAELPEVYVKRGQAYSLIGRQEAAIADFKSVIDKAPLNPNSDVAIRLLLSIQKNGYPVSELAEYQRKFMQANPESLVAVEAEFGMAVVPFNQEDFEMATQTLGEFLRKYSKTPFASEAFYKLGFSYQEVNKFASAIESYKQVQGAYQSKALKSAGDLELQLGMPSEAVTSFLALKRIASSKREEEQALVGLMSAYLGINDYEAAIGYADQIINEKRTKYVDDAYLCKGKAAHQQQRYSEALQYYRMVTQMSAKQEEGAEAQYMIGVMLRDQKDYQGSIAEFIKVRTEYEGYNNWILKAYLILAENYIDIDNTYQAKTTLESIVATSDNPEITKAAQNRLAQLQSEGKI